MIKVKPDKWFYDTMNAKNLIEYKQDRTEYMIGLICQVSFAGEFEKHSKTTDSYDKRA